MNENLYEQLFEQSVDGILLVRGSSIFRVNRSFSMLLGIEESELLGKDPRSLIHPEDRDIATQRMSDIASSPSETSSQTYRVIHRDGHILWIEATSRMIPWCGQPVIQSIVRDVTDRVHALRRLQEKEGYLRLLIEHAAEAILTTDPEGTITEWNPATEELIGIPKAAVLGKSLIQLAEELIRPSSDQGSCPSIASELLSSFFAGSDASQLEAQHTFDIVRPDRKRRIVRAYAFPIPTAKGRTLCAFLSDVTEAQRAEEALRSSEARYRSLFDSIPIGLYRTAPDGTIQDVNPALVAMLGYPDRDTLLSVRVEDSYAQATARRAWCERIEREGTINGSEAIWKKHDGTPLWIEEFARAVRDEHGAVVRYEGSAQDISGRKRIEAELRREKTLFEQLLSHAPEAIVLCSHDSVIHRINPEFERLFGYSQDEAKGRSVDELLAPSDPKFENEASSITYQVAHGTSIAVETVRQRKDGSLVEVSILGQPIRMKSSQIGVYGIYRDITDRKTIERTLEREKAYFEQLFAGAPEAFVLCDNDLRIVRINATFSSLFGYSEDDAMGKNLDDLLASGSKEIIEEASEMTEDIAKGRSASRESVRLRSDGTPCDVSILAQPIFIDGTQVGVYGIYRDITVRKQAERALANAQEKLEKLHDAAVVMEQASTESSVYDHTIDAANRILGFGHCALDIREGDTLTTVAASEEAPPARWRTVLLSDAGIAGRALSEGKPILMDPPSRSEIVEDIDHHIQCLITVPMGDLGVFQAASSKLHTFSKDDIRFVRILLGHCVEALARIRLQNKLHDQAMRDPLTGVFNRRHFNTIIDSEVRRAKRYEHGIGLLMIDANRFKHINDHYGHHVGDEVLRTIARALVASVRETDFIVRYGGDEFLIALTKSEDDPDRVADRIRTAIEAAEIKIDGQRVPISVSVGTACWDPTSGTSVEDALARADERMYQDKRER